MQNPFLNLRLQPVADAEIHQAAGAPSGLTALFNQEKLAEGGQRPSFSGTFQQVVSDAAETQTAESVVQQELPTAGKPLPEPPDLEAPDPSVETLASQVEVVEDPVSPPAKIDLADEYRLPAQKIDVTAAALGPNISPQPSPSEPPDSLLQEWPAPSNSASGKESLNRAAAAATIPTPPTVPSQTPLEAKNLLESAAMKPLSTEENLLARQSPPVANGKEAIPRQPAPAGDEVVSSRLQARDALNLPPAAVSRPAATGADGMAESLLAPASHTRQGKAAPEQLGLRSTEAQNIVGSRSSVIAMEEGMKEAAGSEAPRPSAESRSLAASEVVRRQSVAAESGYRAQSVAAKSAQLSAAALALATAENRGATASPELPRQPFAALQQPAERQRLTPRAEKQSGVIQAPLISPAILQKSMETQRQAVQAAGVGGATIPVDGLAAARTETIAAVTPVQASLHAAGSTSPPLPVSAATLPPATGMSSISVPVGHAAWEQSMAKQVLQAGQNQMQKLEIRLNPSNLGALNVQISVDADTTSILFSSHHALVRDAVEGAIPRLREMFNTSGMNLGDVNVANQSAAEQQGRQSSQQYQPGQILGDTGSGAQTDPLADGAKNTPVIPTEQLLDYYI
ncbi:flagellar hook-length control protein FliK [Thiolapillus sp.]